MDDIAPPTYDGHGAHGASASSPFGPFGPFLDAVEPLGGQLYAEGEQQHARKFQCPICDKRLARRTTLQEHLRTHAADRPFSCDTCGRAFARKNDLKRHELVHAQEAKKFVCGGELGSGRRWGCGLRVHRADALQAHYRTKSGQKCIGPHLDELRVEASAGDWDGVKQPGVLARSSSPYSATSERSRERLTPPPSRTGRAEIPHGEAAMLAGAYKMPAGSAREDRDPQALDNDLDLACARALRAKTPASPLTCRACWRRHQGLDKLLLHLESHVDDVRNPPFQCPTCGIAFILQDSFVIHMLSFRAGEWVCACLRTFTSHDDVAVHLGSASGAYCVEQMRRKDREKMGRLTAQLSDLLEQSALPPALRMSALSLLGSMTLPGEGFPPSALS